MSFWFLFRPSMILLLLVPLNYLISRKGGKHTPVKLKGTKRWVVKIIPILLMVCMIFAHSFFTNSNKATTDDVFGSSMNYGSDFDQSSKFDLITNWVGSYILMTSLNICEIFNLFNLNYVILKTIFWFASVVTFGAEFWNKTYDSNISSDSTQTMLDLSLINFLVAIINCYLSFYEMRCERQERNPNGKWSKLEMIRWCMHNLTSSWVWSLMFKSSKNDLQIKDIPDIIAKFTTELNADENVIEVRGVMEKLDDFEEEKLDVNNEPMRNLKILLMGETGVGKSATGNTILGRRHFVSCGGGASVTKEFRSGVTNIGNSEITLIDVPGFRDTTMKDAKQQVKFVAEAVARAMVQVREGFDAVLLVFPYTRRWTKDEQKSIELFLKIFDKQGFSKNGILVFTHGDSFRREHGGADVKQWIKDNSPDQKWMLGLCSNRCVLFDNVTDDDTIKTSQLNELLSLVDGIQRESRDRYVPRVTRALKSSPETFFKIVSYEKVLGEIGVLDSLIWGDGSRRNIQQVKEKGKFVYDMLVDEKLLFSVSLSTLKKLQELSSLFDGSQEHKEIYTNEAVKPLQAKIHAMMEKTEYWGSLNNRILAILLGACVIL